MPLPNGVPTPWVHAPTHSNPKFNLNAVAGRYVVVFLPGSDPVRRDATISAVMANKDAFDLVRVMGFVVLEDQGVFQAQAEHLGLKWFLDQGQALKRQLGGINSDGVEAPHWLLIDPSLRNLASGSLDSLPALFTLLRALPNPDAHAGTPVIAPVLIVPRILEPSLCRRLIALYQDHGGEPSGVMREVDGKTVAFLDDFKKRRDVTITDEGLRAELRARVRLRLLPEVQKAFQFKITQMERYIVAAYDASDGGYFRPHRDNTTPGTAHRRFACSINLNAEAFEGGDLRFAEFGSRTYRPPTGGAVIFSCSLLHEATPVTKGTRYAFLPFFYDDEGARIREANMASFAPHPQAEAQTPRTTG